MKAYLRYKKHRLSFPVSASFVARFVVKEMCGELKRSQRRALVRAVAASLRRAKRQVGHMVLLSASAVQGDAAFILRL